MAKINDDELKLEVNNDSLDEDKKEVETDYEEEDRELLEEAKAMFAIANEGTHEIRRNAMDDNRFYNEDMWDADIRDAAQNANEPISCAPRIPVYVKQIENDLRQQEMSVNVTPLDGQGSDKVAQVLRGIVRGIEERSKAKSQYIQAAGEAGALVLGFGFLKLELDYASNKGFEQDIFIRAVKDPLSIMWDPNCQEADFADADFWFEFKDYPEKQFKLAFPKAESLSIDMFPAGTEEWTANGNIRVARYWYKETTSNYTYMLDDGTVIQEKNVADYDVLDEEDGKEWKFGDADKKSVKKMKDKTDKHKVIRQKREITSTKIKFCDLTGAEILHQGTWEGDDFPFIAVTGPQSIVNGKRDIRGTIRHAKDAQIALNYVQSKILSRIQSTNKTKYIVDPRGTAGVEGDWDALNYGPGKPYMRYNFSDIKGAPTAPPIPVDGRAQIDDLLALKQSYDIDIQRAMGMFDAGIGATPNEQSGIAIKTLAQHGKNANYHVGENFGAALHTLGTRLINLIPKIYDSARIVKTVSPEGEMEMQAINQIVMNGGKEEAVDVAGSDGHYDVAIDIGPGFATKKQEALQGIEMLMRADPTVGALLADIIAASSDYPQAEIMRDRLLKRAMMQFPGIIEQPGQNDIPPQVQAQMAQMQQQLQMSQQQLQEVSAQAQQFKYQIDTKQTEIQGNMQLATVKHQQIMEENAQKLQAEGQIAQMRNQFAMEIANREQAFQERLAQHEQMFEEVKARLDYELAFRKAETEDRKVTADIVLAAGSQAAEIMQSEVPGIDAALDAQNN